MPRYVEKVLEITTDASGDAVASTQPVSGEIHRVAISYGSSVAGRDVTIVIDDTIDVPVLTLTDNNTDAVYQPVSLVQDSADGSNIAGLYGRIHVNDLPIKVTVAEGGNAQSLTVKILVIEDSIARLVS